MRHDVRHRAAVAAITVLRGSALILLGAQLVPAAHLLPAGFGGFWLKLVTALLLLFTAVDSLVQARRQPESAPESEDTLTMLGPVWVEHPEADFASPPRRFT